MSASVGAVLVAKLEDLLHYLAHGGERVQLAPLHRIEEPLQLRVALDGAHEVRLRASRCNREDLPGQMLSAALLEQPGRLEVRAMLRDLLPQDVDVLAARRLSQHDR